MLTFLFVFATVLTFYLELTRPNEQKKVFNIIICIIVVYE